MAEGKGVDSRTTGFVFEAALLCVVLAVAFILRQQLYVRLFPDSFSYLTFARNIWSGIHHTGELTIASYRRPPLYPHLIAFFSFGDLSSLNLVEVGRQISIAFGTLLLIPLYFLGRKFYGPTAALFATALAALVPEFLYYSGTVLTESLAAFLVLVNLLVLWVLCSQRELWDPAKRTVLYGILFFLGGILGISFLARHASIGFVPISLVLLAVTVFTDQGMPTFLGRVRTVVVVSLVVLAGYLVAVSPQVFYLHGETGRWAMAIDPTGIEHNLAVAGAETRYTDAYESLDAITEDGLQYRWEREPEIGLGAIIARNPVQYLRAYLATLWRGFLPDTYPLPYPAVVLFFVLVGGIGLAVKRRFAALFFSLWVYGGYYFFIALFLNFRDRHMFPVLPVILLVAGVGLAKSMDVICGCVKNEDLRRRVTPVLRGVLLAGVFLVFFPKALALMDDVNDTNSLVMLEQVGGEIAGHVEKDAVFFDRTAGFTFFSGGLWAAVPYAEIDEVVRFARERGVGYWIVSRFYVPELRPQFLPLLDPSLRHQGLEPITQFNSGEEVFFVVYRILPAGE